MYPNVGPGTETYRQTMAQVYVLTGRQNRITVLSRLWNLLLVSCGGAPTFGKEEAASWRMGAEPG